jgi:hypothetical protein
MAKERQWWMASDHSMGFFGFLFAQKLALSRIFCATFRDV